MQANNPPRHAVRLKSDSLRLFFALWPDAEIRAALSDLAHRYRGECGGRTMRAETLHLTLLFVGMLPRRQLQALIAATDGLAFRSFDLELAAWRCWRHPRIGYAAPQASPAALDDLAHALRERLSVAGLPFDAKAFSPHVTLLRNIERTTSAQAIVPILWPVRSFALVQSIPTASGVRYEILKAWPPTK